jgi:hypothetical protein
MRKHAVILSVFALFLQSCGSSAPTPTSVPTSTFTATITSTATETPSVTPSPTIVKIPTVDYNASPTPPMFIYLSPTSPPGMPTYTPMPTPTPASVGPGFEWLRTSGTMFYWGICKPNTIKVTVQVTDPEIVNSVTLFVKTRRLKAQIFTPWNKGIGMVHIGDGTWEANLYANSIDGHIAYRSGWLWYQVVAVGEDNIEVGRTRIYQDAIKFEPCMCMTPPCKP